MKKITQGLAAGAVVLGLGGPGSALSQTATPAAMTAAQQETVDYMKAMIESRFSALAALLAEGNKEGNTLEKVPAANCLSAIGASAGLLKATDEIHRTPLLVVHASKDAAHYVFVVNTAAKTIAAFAGNTLDRAGICAFDGDKPETFRPNVEDLIYTEALSAIKAQKLGRGR